MTVREYIESMKKISTCHQITFIRAHAQKDDNSPLYHPAYTTGAILYLDEVKHPDLLDSIVLNDNQRPIVWLSGVDWNNLIGIGIVKSLLIIHPRDFNLLYPGKQQEHMIQFIDKQLDTYDTLKKRRS